MTCNGSLLFGRLRGCKPENNCACFASAAVCLVAAEDAWTVSQRANLPKVWNLREVRALPPASQSKRPQIHLGQVFVIEVEPVVLPLCRVPLCAHQHAEALSTGNRLA